ncbi:hypothetical protein ACTFIR_002419 [Dictyostelium discoideum]
MDIDMINENQNYHEIIKIAKSYNIKIKGNKSEIIKRINKYIKEKKENKLQTKEITFKSKIDDLPIKDIEISERLFWKIFKNKVLFKNIFSNFHHSFLNSYHCINDLSFMVKNNQIELLKDKVYKNQLHIEYNEYLPKQQPQQQQQLVSRSVNSKPIKSLHWYEYIFKAIKDDVNFYQYLFLNYNKYFLNNYYQVVLSAIEHGCLIALKILLEEGYYQFEQISSSSINIQKTNPTSKINNPSITKIQLLTSAIRNACIYSKLKIYKYLTEDYMVNTIYLSKNEKKEISNLLIESNFFRCISSSGKKSTMKFLNYLFDSNGKFKSIIDNRPIKTMLQTEIQSNFFSGKKSILRIFSLSNLIESVKIFELLSNENFDWSKIEYTNEQLNSKLIFLLDQGLVLSSSSSSSTKSIKDMVIQLFNNLCSYVGLPLYDYILINKEVSQSLGVSIVPLLLKISLKFGNHSIFEQIQKKYPNYLTDVWPCAIPNKIELFKFCKNNRERKVQFIKGIIHPISDPGNSNAILFVLRLLIRNDDISLLELAVEELGGISQASLLFKTLTSNSNENFKHFIFNCFMSTSMLEYCFNNFPWIFDLVEKEKNCVEIWCRLGRMDLLKRFEQFIDHEKYDKFLLIIKKRLNFVNYPTAFKQSNQHLFSKIASHIVKKPEVCWNFDETILQLSKPIPNQQHYENIKHLIEKSTIKSYQPFQSLYDPIELLNTWDINLLDWLFSFNDGNEIKSGRCILDFNTFFTGLILTNRLNDKNWVDWALSSSKFSIGISPKNIFKIVVPLLKKTRLSLIIDQIFNYYFLPNINSINNNKNDDTNKEEYFENFKQICLVLDLKSFKHIYYNYSKFLVIKKQKSNNDCDGLFTLKELQFLISNAEMNHLFNLIDFFNNIGIIKIK